MLIDVGQVRELYRYPVKSMASVAVDSTLLGWHGVEGDRRFAFRRMSDNSGFPWLTASRFPQLILYQPLGQDTSVKEPAPTHVRTPEGVDVTLRGEALCADISERFGSAVELMNINHGVFDAAAVSIITPATILGIEHHAEIPLDTRRFRPNIVLETHENQPFREDNWVGGTLVFGNDGSGAAITITMRDERCMMINLDPDTAKQDAPVLKAVARMNQNNAGVYGTVVRTGVIAVGQRVTLLVQPNQYLREYWEKPGA
jgi:uncharacterized protein YcbX